jgi:hypothetical protein
LLACWASRSAGRDKLGGCTETAQAAGRRAGLAALSTGSTIGSIRNVAVAALTKNFADELAPSGISVVSVHPGRTRTEKTPEFVERQAKAHGVTPDEIERRLAEANLARRVITRQKRKAAAHRLGFRPRQRKPPGCHRLGVERFPEIVELLARAGRRLRVEPGAIDGGCCWCSARQTPGTFPAWAAVRSRMAWILEPVSVESRTGLCSAPPTPAGKGFREARDRAGILGPGRVFVRHRDGKAADS